MNIKQYVYKKTYLTGGELETLKHEVEVLTELVQMLVSNAYSKSTAYLDEFEREYQSVFEDVD